MIPDMFEAAFFLNESTLASVHAKTSESAHLSRSPEWLQGLCAHECV